MAANSQRKKLMPDPYAVPWKELTLEDAVAMLDGVPTFTLMTALAQRGLRGGQSLAECSDDDGLQDLAGELPSLTMLRVLAARGGHPGATAAAVLLCAKKSQDYNHGQGDLDIHRVDRSAYFPFGAVSYAQMLHTKAQRFNSLVQKALDGGEPNFEGLRDTALDIINYAGFYVASCDETEERSRDA